MMMGMIWVMSLRELLILLIFREMRSKLMMTILMRSMSLEDKELQSKLTKMIFSNNRSFRAP